MCTHSKIIKALKRKFRKDGYAVEDAAPNKIWINVKGMPQVEEDGRWITLRPFIEDTGDKKLRIGIESHEGGVATSEIVLKELPGRAITHRDFDTMVEAVLASQQRSKVIEILREKFLKAGYQVGDVGGDRIWLDREDFAPDFSHATILPCLWNTGNGDLEIGLYSPTGKLNNAVLTARAGLLIEEVGNKAAAMLGGKVTKTTEPAPEALHVTQSGRSMEAENDFDAWWYEVPLQVYRELTESGVDVLEHCMVQAEKSLRPQNRKYAYTMEGELIFPADPEDDIGVVMATRGKLNEAKDHLYLKIQQKHGIRLFLPNAPNMPSPASFGG